jgi:hypothetical protein
MTLPPADSTFLYNLVIRRWYYEAGSHRDGSLAAPEMAGAVGREAARDRGSRNRR